MNRRAEEHEAKLAELMERDEVRTMQQDCPMTPTADELRRAENGDPWAVLLVGLLRVARANHGVQPTAELAGREGLAAESETVRQPSE